MSIKDDYMIGPVEIKPGRKSSNGNYFKYYTQPFRIKHIKLSDNLSYARVLIADNTGHTFYAWADAFLPNKDINEFNIFW